MLFSYAYRALFFQLGTVGALLLLSTATLHAQDMPNWMGVPTYGTVTLNAGFSPDPSTHPVRAGGPLRVSHSGCNGYVSPSAPDLDLNYTSGSLPLYIEAVSDSDVTLLVYTPNGEWVCDDDGGAGTNARLTFDSPQNGNYNIWVGTYSSSAGTPEATISITELSSRLVADARQGATTQNNPVSTSRNTASSSPLNWQTNPTYEAVSLDAGFWPDPYSVGIVMGGSTSNPVSGAACRGYVASRGPDVTLTYRVGSSSLYLYTDEDIDTTMVVRTPGGSWVCDDDGGRGTNALVSFSSPESGTYAVWVGTYSENDNYSSGQLHISEINPQ
ncbi:MAG: hypothetical protein PPP56_06195 [Longimonas sp.]|uniref:hypothetical protein n=1 Tax=Longimonas sp. TaxID=2039626 RepID=UPI003358F8D0